MTPKLPLLETHSSKPDTLPVNLLSAPEKQAFLERLAATAKEGRQLLGNDLGLAPVIGELAAAIRYDLILHPADCPAIDAVARERRELKHSIKTAAPGRIESWGTTIEKYGSCDVLSVVTLDSDYRPEQILAAPKQVVLKVLQSEMAETENLKNKQTISYSVMLAASLLWLSELLHSSRTRKSNRARRSWYLSLAQTADLSEEVVILRLAQAIHQSLERLLSMGMVRVSITEPYLTVDQVAKILNVDAETVRRYARKRVFTTIDIPGGSIRFDPKVLAEEINQYVRPSKFRKAQ
jgi:hypothetical protein